MYEICIRLFAETFEQRVVANNIKLIPTHCGNFVVFIFRVESLNINRKYAQAIYVTFSRTATHKLLAYTYPQNWLSKMDKNFVQAMCSEIGHRNTCFSLSREKNFVGRC